MYISDPKFATLGPSYNIKGSLYVHSASNTLSVKSMEYPVDFKEKLLGQ